MVTVGHVVQLALEQSLTIPNCNTVTCTDVDFTVTGLTTDMTVMVNPTSAMPTNLGLAGARVKSANTLTLRFVNPTAGTITGAAVTFKIVAF